MFFMVKGTVIDARMNCKKKAFEKKKKLREENKDEDGLPAFWSQGKEIKPKSKEKEHVIVNKRFVKVPKQTKNKPKEMTKPKVKPTNLDSSLQLESIEEVDSETEKSEVDPRKYGDFFAQNASLFMSKPKTKLTAAESKQIKAEQRMINSLLAPVVEPETISQKQIKNTTDKLLNIGQTLKVTYKKESKHKRKESNEDWA